MSTTRVSRTRLAASLLLVGVVAAACTGGGTKSPSNTPGNAAGGVVTTVPAAAQRDAQAPVSVGAAPAPAASDLSGVDSALKNLDNGLGASDAGISQQEGDPTK